MIKPLTHSLATSRPFQLGAVILAAGASSRMGCPKLLLPWNGTTVLGHLIDQWNRIIAQSQQPAPVVAVVCAADDSTIAYELARISSITAPPPVTIVNPQPQRGMFSSIQAAANWSGWPSAVSHLAILLGDQPHLSDKALITLVTFARHNPEGICQPARAGQPRHPVIVPRSFLEELATTTLPTLKDYLASRAANRAFVEMDDPAFDLDLDTPQDYEAALRRFR